MVCQRSRNSGGAKNQAKKKSKGAIKKQSDVKVAPLTKESIDRILPTPAQTMAGKTATTVSLDETRSVTSNNSAGSITPSTNSSATHGMANVIKQGISTDRAFVDMAVKQRDEMERMRVAQALLYKAFTSAVQEQTRHE